MTNQNTKLKLIFYLLAVLFFFFLTDKAQAATINAASCLEADVEAAIAASSNEDTVTVPAGSCTWVSVALSKAIILQGNGIGSTIITGNASDSNGALNITGHATLNTKITGFTFLNIAAVGYYPVIRVTGVYSNTGTVRITGNTLTTGINNYVMLKLENNQATLFDHNTMNVNSTGASESTILFGDGQASWERASNMGSGTGLYIFEDNTYDGSAGGHGGWTSPYHSWYGARIVFRYNTVYNLYPDGHPNTWGWAYGVRQMEIYNNTFTNANRILDLKSGTAVIYNNTWNNSARITLHAPTLYSPSDTNSQCCLTSALTNAACTQRPGFGANYALDPIYIWGNTSNSVILVGPYPDICGNSQDTANAIRQNIEYYLQAKSGYTAYTYPHPLTLTGTPTPTPVPLPSGGIQAESGALVSPMQTVTDSAASGNAYIMTTTGESGTAVYNFNIANEGVYRIIARAWTADSNTDSFYFKIDNQAEDIWDLNPSAAAPEYNIWREDEVTKRGVGTFDNPQYDPYTFNLTAGNHALTFRGREANARLDYFYLVNIGSIDTIPPAAPTGLVVH